jgi:hypothetical protein
MDIFIKLISGILFLSVLLFIGLYAPEDLLTPKSRYIEAPEIFCIDKCIEQKFSTFHSSGKSWGTASSSMNGLGQEEIFKVVNEYCIKFVQSAKCCSFTDVANYYLIRPSCNRKEQL